MNEPFLSAEKARMVFWVKLIWRPLRTRHSALQHPQWTATKLPKVSLIAWFHQKSTMHIDIKGICSDFKIKRCKVKLVVYFSLQWSEPACKRLLSINATKNFCCSVVFRALTGITTFNSNQTASQPPG